MAASLRSIRHPDAAMMTLAPLPAAALCSFVFVFDSSESAAASDDDSFSADSFLRNREVGFQATILPISIFDEVQLHEHVQIFGTVVCS